MLMPVDSDIALVKIDGTDLPYLNIANDYNVRKGEPVLSIGHAKGFMWSVTNGIVANPTVKMGKARVELMQVTAPMNPGCSGGPVLNKFGQVIGLNQGIMPDMWGTYLAVPAGQILGMLGDVANTPLDTDIEPVPEEESETDSD